jgi:hypothetical protein
MIKKTALWIIVIVCALGVIGVGFELGTSDPIQNGPAVDTGSQMNNMVVATTPIPTATVAVAKTTAATPQPTTVVTMVPTTAPVVTTVTANEPVAKSVTVYDVVVAAESAEPIGNGQFQHYATLENKLSQKMIIWLRLEIGPKNDDGYTISRVEIPAKGTVTVLVPGAVNSNSGSMGFSVRSLSTLR